jgi:hypothetical protein
MSGRSAELALFQARGLLFFAAQRVQEKFMRLFALFCASVIVLSLTAAATAQEKPRDNEGRWEGNVVRNNPDKSTLIVRSKDSNIERTVHYDGGTRWVSQEHGSNKINEIDPTQVKENDRVIARGIWDRGALYATLISKRLSHSD